jgi:small subunit ribosomal protein S2
VAAVSAELASGERKVISDGSDGPVVEIIKRSVVETVVEPVTADAPQAGNETADDNTEDSSVAETTGEKDDNN